MQSITMAKTTCWIKHTKRIKVEKRGDKTGKVLYKLMDNALCGKTMENLRHWFDIRLVSNENTI